jgi:hypothetical protein
MACTYDIFYDRWRSCTLSYTFGTLSNRIGAYRYISAIASCDSRRVKAIVICFFSNTYVVLKIKIKLNDAEFHFV